MGETFAFECNAMRMPARFFKTIFGGSRCFSVFAFFWAITLSDVELEGNRLF